MTPNRIWELVSRIYDNVETALWATMLAFVIYFVVFDVPNLPAHWARAERIMAQEIAAENPHYCEMIGLKAGTQKHVQCVLYLGEFRLKVEKRIIDESEF
jgi:hypothetical protein